VADDLVLHRAAQLEDALHAVVERRLRQRGWQIGVIPYTGYGAPGWVRVMARVRLARLPNRIKRKPAKLRGWRSFATLPIKHTPVVIEAGGIRQETRTDRGEEAEHEGRDQDGSVERAVENAIRQPRRPNPPQQLSSRDTEEAADGRAAGGKQKALDQQEPHDAPTTRADAHPDGELALASDATREQ